MQIDAGMIQAMLAHANIGEELKSFEIVPMPDYAVNVVCFINSHLVLRWSEIDAEVRFGRERLLLESLREFPFVPTIIADGPVPGVEEGFFQIQGRVAGNQVYELWESASESLREQWISELAVAMRAVHRKPESTYRIGHYQSTIRNWKGRWMDGHDHLMENLLRTAYSRSPVPWEKELMQRAERFYADHRGSLAFEAGPCIGHGDLHLLNVLGTPNGMSGIIDWEWSYGGGVEPEYDLDALVRWALYPADIGDDDVEPIHTPEMFRQVIPTLLTSYPGLASIPDLAIRMTIYQIEHELHNICSWKPAIPRRPLQRLSFWVDDRVLDDELRTV